MKMVLMKNILQLFHEKSSAEKSVFVILLVSTFLAFWFYIFLRIRRYSLREAFKALRNGRYTRIELIHPYIRINAGERNNQVFRLNIRAPSDRTYDVLNRVILSVFRATQNLSFVGPNGDTNEHLNRHDIDGIYVRTNVNGQNVN